MSRNIGTTGCCRTTPVLTGPIRGITQAEARGYFKEYQGMYVADAECEVCGSKYIAWMGGIPESGGGWSPYSEEIHDLSYRSTFDDEPGPGDVPERRGGWMQMSGGTQFWPLDPRAEEIYIEDIAHALSNLCRFGGHCRRFYSVAQHCCIVSDNLPTFLAFQGLMHDASEAYLVDMPRPIKVSLPDYRAAEAQLELVIAERFNLPYMMNPLVKNADRRALFTEKRDLMPATATGLTWDPRGEVPPYDSKIVPWEPTRAYGEFMARWLELAPSTILEEETT